MLFYENKVCSHKAFYYFPHINLKKLSTVVFFFSYFTQNSRNKVSVASQARHLASLQGSIQRPGRAGRHQGGLSLAPGGERGGWWAGCHFPLISQVALGPYGFDTSGTLWFPTWVPTLSPLTLSPRWACISCSHISYPIPLVYGKLRSTAIV